MSDGIRDSYKSFYIGPDSKDSDPFELNLSDFDDPTEVEGRKAFNFTDYLKNWENKYKKVKCDCGGEVAKTTHALYCSTNKN